MSQHLNEVTVQVGKWQDEYVTLSTTVLGKLKSLVFDAGELRFVANKERGAQVLVWRDRTASGKMSTKQRLVYDKGLRVLCRRDDEVYWL